jgi:hypothetical protein
MTQRRMSGTRIGPTPLSERRMARSVVMSVLGSPSDLSAIPGEACNLLVGQLNTLAARQTPNRTRVESSGNSCWHGAPSHPSRDRQPDDLDGGGVAQRHRTSFTSVLRSLAIRLEGGS